MQEEPICGDDLRARAIVCYCREASPHGVHVRVSTLKPGRSTVEDKRRERCSGSLDVFGGICMSDTLKYTLVTCSSGRADEVVSEAALSSDTAATTYTFKTLTQLIKLNTITNGSPNADGWLQIWYDGSLVLDYRRIKWRKTSTVGFTGIDFQTFFGGSDSTWAASKDEVTRFKNFRLEWS